MADTGARQNDLQNRLASRNDVGGDRLEGRQDLRGDRQDNRQDLQGDRQGDRQDLQGDRQDNRQDLQGDRQDLRGDRQDNRQDVRDDWADGDRREDWQNWADDHDGAYHDWHHGYWHGHGDGWWDHLWDEHPVAGALGLTSWGINRAAYGFGLWGYTNPYYVEPYAVGNSYIDYSEPLIISEPYPVEVPVQTEVPVQNGVPVQTTGGATSLGVEPLPPGVTQPGLDAFNQARTAFYSGDYTTALSAIDQAAVEMPKDATVHEFRGLVLFALGKYDEAAAPVHAVLAVGPGWDWTTMVGLYQSVDDYTAQFRTLEKYVREHPSDAPSHFLAAYHYITTSNTKAAISRLREVTQLRPEDTVAAELLRMLSGSEGDSQPATAPPTPEPTSPATAPVTPEQLKGNWVASGPNGSEYRVSFADDGAFRWTYASDGKKDEIGGVFAVDGDVLAMEPDTGGMLAARVSKPSSTTLVFEAAGAPANAPSLKFQQAMP